MICRFDLQPQVILLLPCSLLTYYLAHDFQKLDKPLLPNDTDIIIYIPAHANEIQMRCRSVPYVLLCKLSSLCMHVNCKHNIIIM